MGLAMPQSEEFTQLAFDAGTVFSPAAPIDEWALFAGRTSQLQSVIDAIIQRGQHAMIFGERGVGKTSLANVLSDYLEARGQQVIAPRVNCDVTDNFSSLWRKILTEIEISRAVRGIGFAAESSLQTENLADNLPEAVTPHDVRKILMMLSRGALLIVIIDEFDRLPKGQTTALFADTIKTLSDHSVGATLVLVGVADSVYELIQEHESIERALVQIPMPRMSEGELHEIMLKGLERLSMDIDGEALSHISLLSQGLPHYTHLLGLHSARAALDSGGKRIMVPHVEAAVQKAMTEAQQSIRNSYHRATTSPRKESLYRQVLLACALANTDELGYFPAAAVREPMSRIMGRYYDIPNFSRHLNDFAEERRGFVLQKTGVKHRIRYRFTDPLMQPYIVMRGLAEELIDKAMMQELRRE